MSQTYDFYCARAEEAAAEVARQERRAAEEAMTTAPVQTA